MTTRRRKMILWLLLTPLLLLVTLGLLLAAERVCGKLALASYRKRLAAKGERLDPRAFMVRPDPSSNGAPLLAEAIGQLEDGTVLPDNPPPRMKLLPSGRAIVGFRLDTWRSDQDTFAWKDAEADLERNAAALDAARAALEMPVFDNEIDFLVGSKMSFSHLVPIKKLATHFGVAAQLYLRKGDTAGARSNLLAQIRLLRALADDRLLISELVRIALAAIARTTTWEALQTNVWSDADLAAIQEGWEKTSFAGSMARSFEGERIFARVSLEGMRTSNQSTVDTLFWEEKMTKMLADEFSTPSVDEPSRADAFLRQLRNQVYCRLWRFAWLDYAERRYLEYAQDLIEITRDVDRHHSMLQAQASADQALTEVTPAGFYDRVRLPNLSSFSTTATAIGQAMRAETERSLILCAIALKRHQLRHGKWPQSLSALAPELIQEIPPDCVDGQPLRYRLTSDDTFLLYSVGKDGKDDGGDPSPVAAAGPASSLWGRKDAVWPSVATPEEVDETKKASE